MPYTDIRFTVKRYNVRKLEYEQIKCCTNIFVPNALYKADRTPENDQKLIDYITGEYDVEATYGDDAKIVEID